MPWMIMVLMVLLTERMAKVLSALVVSCTKVSPLAGDEPLLFSQVVMSGVRLSGIDQLRLLTV